LTKWNIERILTSFGLDGPLKAFELKVQNYKWMPKWATQFLKIIFVPRDALFNDAWDILSQKKFLTSSSNW
ncbi:unnamed protein product, partial [Allacma fusca]